MKAARQAQLVTLILGFFGFFGLTGCFDSTTPDNYFPGLTDNSVPPSASTFAVGGDVSGTLANITVNKVGQYTTGQIAGAITTLATATDAKQPSSLVFRDGAGSFAATAINATTFTGALTGNASSSSVAAYSIGQMGPDINMTASLPATGASAFKVIGGTPAQLIAAYMPTTLPSGAQLTLLFTGAAITIRNSAGLILGGYPKYRTILNGTDTFTFVYNGTGTTFWREVSRSVAPSRIAGQIDVAQPIPAATPTNIDFTETMDTLSEFDHPSGAATLNKKQGGVYHVNIQLVSDPRTWAGGETCQLNVRVNGITMLSAADYPANNTPCRLNLDGVLDLDPDVIVPVDFQVTSSNAITFSASNPTYNRISIERLP